MVTTRELLKIKRILEGKSNKKLSKTNEENFSPSAELISKIGKLTFNDKVKRNTVSTT